MASVGPGVAEIRIHSGVEHRVFYVAKFQEAIYVLHAFEKRTRQTRQADLELASRRLARNGSCASEKVGPPNGHQDSSLDRATSFRISDSRPRNRRTSSCGPTS